MTNIGLRHQTSLGNHYVWYDTGSGYSATHLGVFKLDTTSRPLEEQFDRLRWSSIGYTLLVRWEDDQEV